MKRVFYIETLYQLVIVMLLKERMIKNVINDVVIVNFRPEIKEIANRLRKINYFNRVYFVEKFEDYKDQNAIYDIKDILLLNNKRYVKKILKKYVGEEFIDHVYDEIWFFNYGALTYSIIKYNDHKGIILNRFEEGLFAFNHEQNYGKRTIYADRIRKLLKKHAYLDMAVDFYCTYPELVKNERFSKVHKIENINESDTALISDLKFVFGINTFDTHGKKYIYFATGCDVNNQIINEDLIIDEIAEVIGKDNMLIKVHPSDKRDIYQKRGYCVCESNDIPWEIIWLTMQFENITMLTLISGCVLNCKVLFEGKCEAIYLYPMVLGRNGAVDKFCDISVKPLINYFNQDRDNPLIYVANNTKELKKILELL